MEASVVPSKLIELGQQVLTDVRFNDETGEAAKAKLVLDEKREVGLERRVLAEFLAAISAILDNRDRRDGIG
jgi:hypothetical protein